MPGQLRAVTNWVGPVGTGAQLANALRSWSVLRFEVTEDPSPGVDGHRFCHTPQLGLWSGAMSANGDVMVGEMRLRAMMAPGRRHPGRRTGLGAGHRVGRGARGLPRRRRRRRGDLAQPRSRLVIGRPAGAESLAYGSLGRPQNLERARHRRHLGRQRADELAVGVDVDAGALDV